VEHTREGRVYSLNTVAEYTYDAWGKPLSTTDGEGNSVANTHIAKLNPLRYRGYYFDMETGFYYLQSRYYDPTLRRFINADSLASTGQGILGTNMFAYCGNEPIRRIEIGGNWWGSDAWEWFCDAASDVWDAISEGSESVQEVVADGANAIGKVATKAWNYGKKIAKKVRNYVKNTDEQVVIDAKFIAFYKGVPVVKIPTGKSSFSFGVIFMGDDVEQHDTVRHEYGHSVHFSQIGPHKYFKYVAIPSLKGFWGETEDYYSQPWECAADVLGGVESRPKGTDILRRAEYFWRFTLLIPF